MELDERLRGFIRSRIKDRVNDSMFDFSDVKEEWDLEITEGHAKKINTAIDGLTDSIVVALMENRK